MTNNPSAKDDAFVTVFPTLPARKGRDFFPGKLLSGALQLQGLLHLIAGSNVTANGNGEHRKRIKNVSKGARIYQDAHPQAC